MSKEQKILELVNNRRNEDFSNYSKEYYKLTDFHNGIYECDYISPWSISANNINSDILVVLQDWSSSDSLSNDKIDYDSINIGHTPSLKTNINLKMLLKDTFNIDDLSNIYVTNLFPFIKKGAMNASIPIKDTTQSATDYILPLIEIIKPKVIVALGKQTYVSIKRAYDLKNKLSKDTIISKMKISDIIEKEPIEIIFDKNISKLYCQSHPGGLGIMNRGGIDIVKNDWKKMKN